MTCSDLEERIYEAENPLEGTRKKVMSEKSYPEDTIGIDEWDRGYDRGYIGGSKDF